MSVRVHATTVAMERGRGHTFQAPKIYISRYDSKKMIRQVRRFDFCFGGFEKQGYLKRWRAGKGLRRSSGVKES